MQHRLRFTSRLIWRLRHIAINCTDLLSNLKFFVPRISFRFSPTCLIWELFTFRAADLYYSDVLMNIINDFIIEFFKFKLTLMIMYIRWFIYLVFLWLFVIQCNNIHCYIIHALFFVIYFPIRFDRCNTLSKSINSLK